MEDSVREVFETRSSIERLAERRGVPTRAASVLNEILSTTVTLNEPISNATHRQTLVRDALEFVNLRVRDSTRPSSDKAALRPILNTQIRISRLLQ